MGPNVLGVPLLSLTQFRAALLQFDRSVSRAGVKILTAYLQIWPSAHFGHLVILFRFANCFIPCSVPVCPLVQMTNFGSWNYEGFGCP